MTGPAERRGAFAALLAARTAHELNNIAAIFSGHIYLLRAEAEPPEEAFSAMDKALAHLERLATSLAALGGLGGDEPERVDLAEVAREAASDGAFAVVFDLPPDLPPVSARRRDLVRAVAALLTNAREAGASEIRLIGRAEARKVTLAVEDSGPGVEPEVRRRNFDPFFTTREKGRGIGIALARLGVGLSGGSLSVDDLPAGGTRAVLALPPAEPEAAA